MGMGIDDFVALAKERRSMRRFKTDPIPDGYVEKILEAARWAQSGSNGQPWEFIVVKDREIKKKIVDVYVQNTKEIYVIETTRVKELRHQGFVKEPTGMPGFANAPVLIVVCADPRTYMATVSIARILDGEGGPKATYHKNVGNTTQIIHLAAAACGLRAQWASVDKLLEQKLKRILDVPDQIEIHTLVPIGYPDYEAPTPYRRELSEIVHYEKYDRSKFRTEEDIVEWIRYLRQRNTGAYYKNLP
jgi:5,6-dimethylbenzimidazole synthase